MAVNFGGKVPSDIRGGEGPWFVQIGGIGSDCTWQDLKDAVRPAASHVGHVQVYANGRGTITCRKWDEAVRVFEYLSSNLMQGRRVYVELWETTPSPPPRLIWKNVGRLPINTAASSKVRQTYASQLSPPVLPQPLEEVGQHIWSLNRAGQPIPMELRTRYSAYQAQAQAQQAMAQQAMWQQSAGNAIPGATMPYPRLQQPQPTPVPSAQYAARQMAANRVPQYATGSSGIPTNLDRGAVRTEKRGVFVSNLSFDVQNEDILNLFSRYGKIVKLDHKREVKTNSKGKPVSRSRGTAIITFATSEQAGAAIADLHEVEWKDRVLTVRFDTDATPLNPPPTRAEAQVSTRRRRRSNDGTPLIVDGSRHGRED